jgi:hypothetical protein
MSRPDGHAAKVRIYWHRFIDHLAGRKSTENFFASLVRLRLRPTTNGKATVLPKREGRSEKGLPFFFRIWPP